MDEERNLHGAYHALLSPREQATIDHALSYAEHFASAGVPGHSAHLLIAKLADELDKPPAVVLRRVHWDEDGKCWRDIETGVSVTAVLSPTTSINDAMSAISDIAELVGWPCFDSNQADDNFSMQFKLGGL